MIWTIENKRWDSNFFFKDMQHTLHWPGAWTEWKEGYDLLMTGNHDDAIGMLVKMKEEGTLILSLHLWELRKEGKITPQVWAVFLRELWIAGKIEPLLSAVKINAETIKEMFDQACPMTLMNSTADQGSNFYDNYLSLPENITLWRGTSENSKHFLNGISWSLNKDTAEWFANREALFGCKHTYLFEANIPRDWILCMFDYEDTVLLDPVKVKNLNLSDCKASKITNFDKQKGAEAKMFRKFQSECSFDFLS